MAETRKLAAILVSMTSSATRASRAPTGTSHACAARLRTLRSDLIDPIISVHHGRVVKRTGTARSSNSAAWSTPCTAPSKSRPL